MNLIGVGDHTAYYYFEEGFNVYKLKKYISKNLCLKDYPTGKNITKEEFFKIECDIIIPAALELQINKLEAENIKTKLIVEAANGPISLEGENILKEKNIEIIPDILANSGGVVVSYYEWLQNKRDENIEYKDVIYNLDRKMKDAYYKILNISNKYKCDFSYQPHTSIEYAHNASGFKPFCVEKITLNCKVHLVDIRSDFPNDWNIIQ